MRNASALFRFVATMIALGVVLGGCGQPLYSPAPDAGSSVGALRRGIGRALRARLPAAGRSGRGAGVPVAAGSAAKTRIGPAVDPAGLPAGSVYRNPANGRDEIIVEDIRHTSPC